MQAKPKAPPKGAKPARTAEAVEWCESYEKAFEEAKERGVPLMIAVIQDGEEANEGVLKDIIKAKEFAGASRGTVNLVACRGDEKEHGTKDETHGNSTVKVCAKFGSITCAQHRKVEQGVFRDFAHDGGVKTPMVLIVQPDLTVLSQLIDRNPMEAYLEAFAEAEKKWPNGFTREEAERIREDLARVQDWIAGGDFDRVIEFALPIRKRGSKGALSTRVDAALKEVEDLGKEELSSIEEQVTAKDFLPALDRLEKMVAKYRGLPLETIAKERRAALEKSPQVKAVVMKAKRETSAREMLTSADQLKAAGDAEKAAKKYQTLREKFADTEAGKELLARPGGGG